MSYSPALQHLLDGLNEYQVAAVNIGGGLASLVGVPGSGKTRTIVARMARMAEDGLDPDYVLAMTFTRAAAAEMTSRLEALNVNRARVGTIHSVCRQIAAAETDLFDHGRLDERNKMQLELKKLLGEFRKKGSIANLGVDFEGVSRYIEACKASGLCHIDGDPLSMNGQAESHHLEMGKKWARSAGVHSKMLATIYVELERRRGSLGLYDFDDMLLWAWMKLIADPEVRLRWRQRWSLVIVDEAQDSNPIQWDIARMLVGLESCIAGVRHLPCAPQRDAEFHNLMVAGDPSQSIYRWRSAEPNLFVEFATSKDVENLVLPLNYRSNQSICSVATGLVRGKRWHLGGEITSTSGLLPPSAVSIKRYNSVEEEAEDIVRRCMELAEDGRGLRSCAVLSRLRVGLDLIEISCIRHRIRYIKQAAGSFFESKEVRDVLAYLRVAANLDPEGTWARHIINRPFRYLGAAYIGKAAAWAEARNMSILDGLEACSDDLNHKQRHAVRDLYSLLQKLNQISVKAEARYQQAERELAERKARGETGLPEDPLALLRRPNGEQEDDELISDEAPLILEGPADMIALVLRETDYIEELRREEGLLGMDESRIAALAALRRMAFLFPTTHTFLSYVDALTVAVEQARKTGLRLQEGAREDALVLSTIHRAKGLEWRHVFLMDVVQGRFPCAKSMDPEEELRLLYVALTRSMDTCQVSYAGPPEDGDSRKPVRSSYILLIEQQLQALAETITEGKKSKAFSSEPKDHDQVRDGV